jgi:hypothetical protein
MQLLEIFKCLVGDLFEKKEVKCERSKFASVAEKIKSRMEEQGRDSSIGDWGKQETTLLDEVMAEVPMK